MRTVIDVQELGISYGDVPAVRDLTFQVYRGEILGILGPNGAGKTSTVECLQGLRERNTGRVEVLGLDPAREGDQLRRRIGSQLQSAALPDRLRVGEAVRFFARAKGAGGDVEKVLEAWDLTRLRKRAFATLSGGERQRLFLALALLGAPEVVFLDELTAALDPSARRETWRLVEQVRDAGATIVLVTHFMEEAAALCDRVAIVDDGRLIALDTPLGLASSVDAEVRVTFSTDGADCDFLVDVPGVTSVERSDDRIEVVGHREISVRVAAALAGRGMVPEDYQTHHPTLEDVFLAQTGRRLTQEVPA